MALTITLKLPPDVEEHVRRESVDLAGEVTEAYVLDLFRRGKLTHFQLSRALGLDRYETDAWLKRHGAFEGSPTMEDLDADLDTLRRITGRAD